MSSRNYVFFTPRCAGSSSNWWLLPAIACYCQVHELVTVDAEDLRFLCAKVLQFPSASVCKVTRKQMQTGSRANHTISAKEGLARLGTDAHSLTLIHINMLNSGRPMEKVF